MVLAKPPFMGLNQSRGHQLRPGLGTPGACGSRGPGAMEREEEGKGCVTPG